MSRRVPTRAFPFSLPAVAGVLALAAALPFAPPARAQMADPNFPVTDGQVYATAQAGSTLYIGGSFNYVLAPTGTFVSETSVGTAGWTHLRVDGPVRCCVADGAGGWWIGGAFATVSGLPRGGVAHVLANGALADGNAALDGAVDALALSGGVLFAGGEFLHAGSLALSRRFVAALDAATSQPTGWNALCTDAVGAKVLALAVTDSTVWIGGTFAHMGGAPRNNLATVSATTGLVRPWDPGGDGEVDALHVRNGKVYVGGTFSTIAGQPHASVAAFNAATGALVTTWVPAAGGHTPPQVSAIASDSVNVFLAGNFGTMNGQPRQNVAVVDSVTGAVTAVTIDCDGEVHSLAVTGRSMFLGGAFSLVASTARRFVAAVDLGDGHPLAWNPGTNGAVRALGVRGALTFMGGDFTGVGGSARSNLAALNLATGAPTTWQPNPDGRVSALAYANGTLYVGGSFNAVGGLARAHLAALRGTAIPTAWDPGPNSNVSALALSGASVFVGGGFTTIGGAARSRIAAVDTSGVLAAWNPGDAASTAWVNTIAVSGATVYAGGSFSRLGGQNRANLAAVDAVTGAATAWNPGANGPVFALLPGGPSVFVGGTFTTLGGASRPAIGAVSPSGAGAVTAWNPVASAPAPSAPGVDAIVRGNGGLLVGGGFEAIGGAARSNVATLDSTGAGSAFAWRPDATSSTLDAVVSTVLPTSSGIVLGGTFTSVAGRPTYGLARLLPADVTAPDAVVISPVAGNTLPIGGTCRLAWSATDDLGVQSVDLLLSRNGAAGPWEPLVVGAPAGLSFDWTATGPATANAVLSVTARDYAGNTATTLSSTFAIAASPASVASPGPPGIELARPAPNPCAGGTTVAFTLSRPASVRLALVDVGGREVARLANGPCGSGRQSLRVDTSHLAPGLYFLRLRAGGTELQQRLAIVR